MDTLFFAVQKAALSELPTGVQKFIRNYFRPITIFGVECYEASSSDTLGTEVDFSSTGETFLKSGVRAGDEYTNNTEYKEGLDPQKYPDGAVSWLHNEAEKLPQWFFTHSTFVIDD